MQSFQSHLCRLFLVAVFARVLLVDDGDAGTQEADPEVNSQFIHVPLNLNVSTVSP